MTKRIVSIVLIIAAIVLAWLVYRSIQEPVKFKYAMNSKETLIVRKMKDIREVELAYRTVYQRFCGSFDTLEMFLQDGQLPTVKKTGAIPDSMSEAQALRLGLITRDTIYENAYDVLSKRFESRLESKEDFISRLRYVPTTNRQEIFNLSAGMIDRSNVKVPVVEVTAHLTQYMKEEKYAQLIRNEIKLREDLNRFPGMKFGSLVETQTEGNWE